jgi:hypothetical protein
MEADHDRQLPRVGPKRPARPAAFLLRLGMAARPRPFRVPNQEFRLFGQVVTWVSATSMIDLAAKN